MNFNTLTDKEFFNYLSENLDIFLNISFCIPILSIINFSNSNVIFKFYFSC